MNNRKTCYRSRMWRVGRAVEGIISVVLFMLLVAMIPVLMFVGEDPLPTPSNDPVIIDTQEDDGTQEDDHAHHSEPLDKWGMTEYELDIVQRVVSQEARGEGYIGQMAVAQCIRETAVATGMTPYEVVMQEGQYASPAETATDSVIDAVYAVLYEGEYAVLQPIRYFYAPGIVYSEWHETELEFVCEIGGHRFFKVK